MNNESIFIENKLKQLGTTSKYGNTSLREIEEIEVTLGINLPNEYKEFLSRFGTLNFNDIEVAFYSVTNSDKEPFKIVNFYGVNGDNFDLKMIINSYTDRIPEDLIPIAECTTLISF
ncbi:SMI1/KNR4 family protein [Bacillus suaedaesalsae]|uniref:SMI1/KNR4 family protein n=1 Tax=Bacillus suaedaesalsae TaxID=2810349 RepID=A0ABS2DFH5_9BACI|nr:SMI1/KNR4 family protein [Bacillus suaedaesalsae]